MQQIYVEQDIIEHKQVQKILKRFKNKNVTLCQHYGEIFNRKQQNFRQQKENPALILAQKKGNRVLATPANFGFADKQNFYFSHLLNCPFDCRYCFLQGMYSSAHYVLFVNYADFAADISDTIAASSIECCFFSGYDADSIAYDPISQFTDYFIPFFQQRPNATLELRTKSANLKCLLKHSASPNIVLAMSLTPETISRAVEHKVAPLERRLTALQQAANHGYPIGLRLDPLIDASNFKMLYSELIKMIMQYIRSDQIHSVSIGPLRFPQKMHQKIHQLYPEDKLLNLPLSKQDKILSYATERQAEMQHIVQQLLTPYINQNKVFSCVS